jgi:hypothetical protein
MGNPMGKLGDLEPSTIYLFGLADLGAMAKHKICVIPSISICS